MNKRANQAPKPSERNTVAKTRSFATHNDNPAGTKIIRRFYRQVHGVRTTPEEALRWYKGLALKGKTLQAALRPK